MRSWNERTRVGVIRGDARLTLRLVISLTFWAHWEGEWKRIHKGRKVCESAEVSGKEAG